MVPSFFVLRSQLLAVGNNVGRNEDDKFEVKLCHNHPLYLHASDASGSLPISVQLIGTENYSLWSGSMKIALIGSNKLDTIGSITMLLSLCG